MRIGIDLLWVRPSKNGGTESYIRNILDGLVAYANDEDIYYLYVSNDNKDSFDKYFEYPIFKCRLCDTYSASQKNRIVWENLYLSKHGIRDGIDVWYMPVYSRPFLMSRKIPIITVIHDIQAMHYPEYFSKGRNLFFRLSWWLDCKTSNQIVTISDYCKKDIMKYYHISENKISVIYNPIITNKSSCDFGELAERYGIADKSFYYSVSSLAKHKNLITLLKALKLFKEKDCIIKLLISGVKVNAESEVTNFIRDNGLDDVVVYTGFISNEERDSLYEHCKGFLFPSVFEGFGMPPIEAMKKGVPVITTKETSLYEVTQGKAEYVENPFDANEWVNKIENIEKSPRLEMHQFPEYDTENIITQYISVFRSVKQ